MTEPEPSHIGISRSDDGVRVVRDEVERFHDQALPWLGASDRFEVLELDGEEVVELPLGPDTARVLELIAPTPGLQEVLQAKLEDEDGAFVDESASAKTPIEPRVQINGAKWGWIRQEPDGDWGLFPEGLTMDPLITISLWQSGSMTGVFTLTGARWNGLFTFFWDWDDVDGTKHLECNYDGLTADEVADWCTGLALNLDEREQVCPFDGDDGWRLTVSVSAPLGEEHRAQVIRGVYMPCEDHINDASDHVLWISDQEWRWSGEGWTRVV